MKETSHGDRLQFQNYWLRNSTKVTESLISISHKLTNSKRKKVNKLNEKSYTFNLKTYVSYLMNFSKEYKTDWHKQPTTRTTLSNMTIY